MSRRTRHITILLLTMLGFSSYALAATTGVATITGTEQITAGIWDFGTVTVTVNNYSESVPYGQYSTPDSLASAIAAKFSTDCKGPANARSAPGGVINFRMKGSATLTQLGVTTSSTLSFSGTPTISPTIPTTTVATIGATMLSPGQSTAVDVQVSCDSACGMVDYRIDGGAWTTGTLDGNGHFSAVTPTNLAAGTHNVVTIFQGSDTYISSTSNPVSFTVSPTPLGANPTAVYSYNISSYTPASNVQAYTDSVNGGWNNITYDGVNRLTGVAYSPGDGSTQYLCWGYDSFGNRKYQTMPTAACSSSAPQLLFYDAGNHLAGLTYDASGNVTNDGTNQYLYDAEGRVCAMKNPGNGVMMQYIYDADGERLAKGAITSWSCDTSSNGFVERSGYVLGPNGEQVTEVDGQGNWVHTNVFAAGKLIATYQPNGQDGQPLVHFQLSDWLGTRRLQTDSMGNTESSYQSLPFGELKTPGQSLGATEQFFTGKERDSESGNDYFGARYYGSSMGRFMSPDSGIDQHPEDPQSWNLYTYGRNNPLVLVDPSGEYVCGSNMSSQQCDNFQKGLDEAQKGANALKDKYGADSSQYKDAQRAVDSYGKQGVDNGVAIMAGKAGSDSITSVANAAGPTTADNPNGQKITVTLGTDKLDGSEGNGLDIGHEGSHVADGSDWVSSGFNPSMNPTRYGTEFRAFQVERNLAEGINWGPLGFPERSGPVYIWKPGWSASQVNAGINSELRQHYNLSPSSKILAFKQNTQGGH